MASVRGTLRLRFTVTSAVSVFVLVAALGAGLSAVWNARLNAARDEGLTGHLDAIVAELRLAGLSTLASAAPLVFPTPETNAQVVAADGTVVAASRRLREAVPLISPREMNGADTVERIVESSALEETVLAKGMRFDLGGEQYLAIAAAPLDAGLERWVPFLAVPAVALLVAGFVALGVWLSVGNALSPVAALADEADEIAAGRRRWELGVQAKGRELVHLSERLDGLLARIREAFEREREFLDDASHELRTPLAIARGELELARAATDDAATQVALDSAIEEIDELDRLTDDLLVLARARGSEGAGRRRAVELAEVCARAASAVDRVSPRSDVSVAVEGGARAEVDPDALERAIGNVIANAVRHARTRVRVTIREDGDRCHLAVDDDGPGFPSGRIDEMFTRFARHSTPGNHGTGLGLPIAAAIVAANGGTISARNPAQGGAQVVIELPLEAPQPQPSTGPGAKLGDDG